MTGSLSTTARVTSVVAGTLVALSCGTNYAYSAWAPQFADRMKLSSTESNLIGVAGNLGMYGMGVPMGLLIDGRGPRLVTLIGSILLALGYYPIYLAYEHGQGSVHLVFLCLFAFLTGAGGSAAFGAAIKVAASNFADSRGTATAVPLAAFGLSALFWSNVSNLIFKDDTGAFLFLMACGTSVLTLVSTPFLRILQSETYSSVPEGPTEPSDSRLMRRRSIIIEHPDGSYSSTARANESSAHVRSHSIGGNKESIRREGILTIEVHHPDIRGLAMLRHVEFWQLFLTMALLSGIGLMTINNIGNSAKALWVYYDDSAKPKFIQQHQVMQVSILSFGNFLGRLSSGIGSDILVKKLGMSRFWCLFVSASVFTLTQLAGASISNPNTLVVVSVFTGIGYGFLFGVFPSLTAHTFGIEGLSQNWGAMTLAPVFSGNIFNLLYGTVYDHHSVIGADGEASCPDGLRCYQSAYYFTFFSGVAGILVCLWSIYRERKIHGSQRKKSDHQIA
ncbi:hypothetical protein N7468_007188 [Penicillium chermesinum]|uniref:Nodulin-like domain-containing protein n=1 Tax=Penicillium chermesinum TaxID=63820 RepID=A0A9W9TKF1_9EURO|nr:uncharacterized protein N7468_007188 [Penicillium chermesinum]KAJ5225963.1 hypothetical protein N7468_007188 [Penicillium chermesinum]